MPVPEAVRKQAERANEFISSDKTDPTLVPVEVLDREKAAVVVEGDSESAVSGTPEKKAPEKSTDQPLVEPLGDEDDKWKQRYQILQGKYNAEVPRLSQELRALKEKQTGAADATEVNNLRSEVSRLTGLLNAAPKPSPINSPDLDSLRENYPAELVDGILAVVQKMVDPVLDRVNTVDKNVSTNAVTDRANRLRTLLAKSDIDYDEINTDPVFVEDWLQQVDDMSGKVRHQLLSDAFNSNDLDRTARFFIAYAKGHANSPESKVSQAKPAADLNRHVRVGDTGNPDPVTQTRAWNAATISQFYTDKRNKKYTEKEAADLEKEIFASTNG